MPIAQLVELFARVLLVTGKRWPLSDVSSSQAAPVSKMEDTTMSNGGRKGHEEQKSDQKRQTKEGKAKKD